MEEKFPKRRTAYKFWIKDIINAVKIEQEGMHLFKIRDKEVSRVNVIAIVIDKQINEEGTFSTITIDDGTETIRVKTWKEDVKKLENIEIEDLVMVIGKLRSYGNELSITAEIVKKQMSDWFFIRKKELKTAYGKPEEGIRKEKKEIQQKAIEEEIIGEPTETTRQKILELVEKETAQEGVRITKLIQESNLKEEEAERIIDELLKEGELFQPKAGFLKVV